MPKLLIPLLVSLLCTASAATAAESAPYFTERAEQVLELEDFDYDSGWQPPSSAIQVRFTAHGGNTVYVGMDGDGFYDWTAQAISFDGLPDGGDFDIDFGIDIQSQVQFDILGYQWQGDLMDPITYGIFEAIVFDPYLLPGDPYRPGVLEATIPAETVLNVPLGIDLIVASGSFHLDIGAEVYAELEGNSITVESETESAIVDAWDLAVSLGADPTSPLDVWATLEAYLYFEVTLLLYPSVVLTVLGSNYTLAQLEIPIDTPPFDDTWVFDPVELNFAVPEDTKPGGQTQDGQTQGGNGDGQDSSTTFSNCSCSAISASGKAGRFWFSLLLLLGLGQNRRRRPAHCFPRSSQRTLP